MIIIFYEIIYNNYTHFSYFFKTGNLLSENNLFNVNNILLEKNDNDSSKQLANKAINEAFNVLIKKILLKDDISKVSNLNSKEIRDLVTYYKISKNTEQNKDKVNFSVTFDKNKIHNLFLSAAFFILIFPIRNFIFYQFLLIKMK